MIKDNQRYFNRLHVLLDALVVAISYIMSWYIRFDSFLYPMAPGVGYLPREIYFFALYFIVPGYIVLYDMFGMYTPKRATGSKKEISGILKSNITGAGIFLITLYAVNEPNFSRSMIALFFVINVVFTTLMRQWIRLVLHHFRAKGYNLKHILLVGYSRAAEEYIKRINSNPQWGYVVRGILDDHVPSGTMYKGVKVIGTINNLEVILPESKLDEIAVSLALQDYGRLEEIVEMCEKSGVHTKFIPDYNSIVPSKPYTEDLQGLPVINIRHVPLTNTVNQVMKRAVDVVGSAVGIVVISPLLLVLAIAVKLSGPGPVIFKQERVGLHNKTFRMYKFRSMVLQTDTDEKKGWTTENDPRVTPVGSFMRRTSLDELPQLWNILKGDMSLVGPRPERPQFVEQFKEEIPRYMIKHQVRPGLTGWAQVNGWRGDSSIRRRIEHDIYYIENWTMWFDIKIMFMTLFKGFVNKNAY